MSLRPYSTRLFLTFDFLLGGCVFFLASVVALDNGLGRVPPMGWNSWNKFGCSISEKDFLRVVDALVVTGMRDAGYIYANLDDCVFSGRDANGTLIPDAAKFPSGIKYLSDYVHGKGMRFGIYTDAGTETCQGRPGLLHYDQQDMDFFAENGVDFVKVDWCHSLGLDPKTRYTQIRDALLRASRPMFFSMCEWGVDKPWEWAMPVGNSWRTTGDISDNWYRMIEITSQMETLGSYAGPGGWNDPDMLEVGNGGMKTHEYIAHFSLWSIMNAPLLSGNDVSNMDNDTRSILLNKDVIAINQDPLGKAGSLRRKYGLFGELQVWSKLMQGNKHAVVLLNKGLLPAVVEVKWSDLGVDDSTIFRCSDLWSKEDLGQHSGSLSRYIPSHSVIMLRFDPV